MLAAWRCSLLLHDFGANWNKWTISWLYYFSCCWIAKKVILAFPRNEAVWFVIEPLTVPLGSFIMLTFLFLLLCHNIYWMDSLTAQIFMECLKVGNTDSQSFKTQLQTVLSSGFCSMSYIFGSISFIFNFFSECKSCKFLLASWTHQLFVFVVFDIGLWIAWSNFDLDLSWPVGFLLKCVAVLAQVDCFAFHLYYTNNLFIFVHVQQLVIGSFKKTYANGISCQVLMTNIWISTLKLLGEEKDGSSFWGVK